MEERIKVLVADDEADFRKLMSFWLVSKGYEVIEAPDGKAAIQMVKKDKPHILFLDLRMPDMDGAETLQKIRRFDAALPVIVISAHLNEEVAKRVMGYGISGIFYKGSNFEEALPLLEAALRTHKRLKKEA